MAKGHKGPLRIAIEDWLATFDLGEILNAWFASWGEKQEEAIVDTHKDSLEVLETIPGLPDVFIRLIKGGAGGKLQGGIATALGFATSIGMGAASAFLAPIMRKINYAMDRKIQSARVDPAAAWMMSWRQPQIMDQVIDGLKDLGYNDELITAFGAFFRPRLSEGDLLTLSLRDPGFMDDALKEMRLKGWTEPDIERIVKLREIIPPVNDLIMMAVREAFDDDVARQFGYDEAFPAEVGDWAEKQGLSQEWSKRYWRAHWVLPSVGQGFQMLHRLRPGEVDNPFTRSELDLLLRALDIPEFWRVRLTELSFRPLTRVDVRRMYGFGTLDESGVMKAYLDLGYDETNAQLMTDFTIKYESGGEKELSKAAIINGFKRGIFSESEAISMLTESGYSVSAAEFYINLAEFDLLEKEIDNELDYIEMLYVNGEVDQSQVYDLLGPLDLTTEQMHKLVREWDLKRKIKTRLPSENELENFYKLEIIDQAAYNQGLVARNYKLDTIDWYIKQADIEIEKEAAKEYERVQKEKERLLDIVELDQYRKDVATLNVDIAALKFDIASLKVIAHDIVDEELLAKLARSISVMKAAIEDLNLQKAELRLALEE